MIAATPWNLPVFLDVNHSVRSANMNVELHARQINLQALVLFNRQMIESTSAALIVPNLTQFVIQLVVQCAQPANVNVNQLASLMEV